VRDLKAALTKTTFSIGLDEGPANYDTTFKHAAILPSFPEGHQHLKDREVTGKSPQIVFGTIPTSYTTETTQSMTNGLKSADLSHHQNESKETKMKLLRRQFVLGEAQVDYQVTIIYV